ncbi:MAG: GGDEF domain-containing protein, partial [Mariprofundus sp.]|nr:GGDEF domain-containing protein [Mariprofundus sp.]
ARMAAEMLRITLTEQMRMGVIQDRESLFNRMRTIPGLVDVRVLRGEPVIKQFGPGLEAEKPKLDMEKRVLASGQWEELLEQVDGKHIYRISIPYIARSTGSLNCLQCHNVPEGSINGAVTLGFSLENMRRSEMVAVAPLVLLLLLFGLALAYFLKRLFKPMVETANSLKSVVSSAEKGDFSGRVISTSTDEIGEIAVQTNNLMQTLDHSIGKISHRISSLGEHRKRQSDQDMLAHTVSIVDEMVGASQFKQAIENDLNLDEIYARLRRVLHDHFALTRFSYYQIEAEKGALKPVFIEGLEEQSELWCDAEIQLNGEACRANRTASCVSSIGDPLICGSFCGNNKDLNDQLVHVCVPMMLSGRVGGVLQVVLTDKEAEQHADIEQMIQIYLNEAAPVIETRQLMQSLKDTAMRDPMTGLYNRRFIEDYIKVLAANIIRQKTSLGVMMCDIDFFKQVNDNYGHDVGDQVIKALADLLQSTVRSADMVVRFGGEEFLILLPNTDADGCMLLAERIRINMEEMVFQTPQGPLKKTLSVGIALFSESSDGFWATVKQADVALYKAKEGGRNQSLIFDQDMWDEQGQY